MAGFGLKEAMMVASILPIGGMLPGGKHETVSKKGSLMEGIGDVFGGGLFSDLIGGAFVKDSKASTRAAAYIPDLGSTEETQAASGALKADKLATADFDTNLKIVEALITKGLTSAVYSEKV